MRKLSFLLVLNVFVSVALAQPIVYFNFLSHNEETTQWNGAVFYNANRDKLIQLSTYFTAHGVSWNLQSDWVYLTNILTKETPALIVTTGNKNILRWMHEDQGVEMDPHAHESQYLYPDVVKLMDSVGLPESKVIGGSIYNDSNGLNIWTNLVNGQYGRIFTSHFWKPDYMMGGGTPNHVNDLKYYGFWNPQSPSNYLTNDSLSPLHHIGVGCEIKIRDTSAISNIVAQVRDVIQKVQNGTYPASGIYLQTVFFEQSDLNTAGFYNKVTAIADSMNVIVATGKAQWKTLKQTYTQWQTTYGAKMFQWECGQVTTGVGQLAKNSFSIFPNPATDKVRIEMNYSEAVNLRIFDASGRVVQQSLLPGGVTEINMQAFPAGLYFFKFERRDAGVVIRKILLM